MCSAALPLFTPSACLCPKGRAPVGFEPIDHALRVKSVKAERTARLDDLGDQALLLIVDKIRAGQFPSQRRRADCRTAVYGEPVRLVACIVAHQWYAPSVYSPTLEQCQNS